MCICINHQKDKIDIVILLHKGDGGDERKTVQLTPHTHTQKKVNKQITYK